MRHNQCISHHPRVYVALLSLCGAFEVADAAAKGGAAPPASGTSTTVVQSYTIDAGALVNQLTVSATASAGDIEVTIKNLLPTTITTYNIAIDVLNIQALPAVLPSPTGGTGLVSNPPTCDELIALYNSHLNSATSETRVAQIGVEFNSLASSASCKSDADQASAKSALTAFQNATTATLDNKISLGAGERIVLTLTRNANGNIASKQLGQYTISTAPLASQWLVFYGANYINTSNQQFFSSTNSGTSPTTYTITPQVNRSNHQFAPSVNFMWLPGQNFECDKSHVLSGCIARAFAWRSEVSDVFGGLSAGLGFGTNNNTSDPIGFLSYGVGWGYNVALMAGVAMHQEQRLLGQYNSGQVITTNMTPAQLAQNVYVPRFYVGLVFRFGSNPFGSKAAASTTNTAKAATPTSTTAPASQ